MNAIEFEKACGAKIRASQVSTEMIELAQSISREEAKALNSAPASAWETSPTISEIESAIPGCRDRQIQAILTVAEKYGR